MTSLLIDTEGVDCCCGPLPAQPIDELRRLLADGTITQEEFDRAVESAPTP